MNGFANQNQDILTSILNGISAMIYVTDLETDEILFINDYMKQHFKIEGDVIGQPCYKVLNQGIEKRCDWCPCHQLDKDPDIEVVWEELNTLTGCYYHNTDKYIDWPNGMKVHIQHCVDISDIKEMQDKLENNNNLLQAVNQASSLLLNADIGSFEKYLDQSVQLIAEALKVDCVYLWKNHTIDGDLYCSQVFEWTKQKIVFAELMPCSYNDVVPEWEETLSAGRYINSVVRDMSQKEQDHLSPEGILSILVIPIFIEKQFWGYVGFDDHKKERIFSAEMEAILHSSSLMLVNAWLRNEMAREKEEANRLTKLMLDSSPLSCHLWDKDIKIFDCNEAGLKLFNFKTKQEFMDRFFECSPEFQLDGQRSVDKAVMYLNKAFEEGRCIFDWIHQIPGSDVQMPVEITLVRVSHRDDFIVAGYTRDLRDIASMENKISRLETEVEKIYYDALTEIFNRRFFDENLTRIMKTLSRYNGTLSLMMIDIDYFKKYNDTYGHSEGDNCLKTVAEILTRSVTRSDDFVVRYGGEEFAAVLPNADEEGARSIAEKMLDNIRSAKIPHISSDAADFVTVSIGVATGIPSPGQSGEDFIKRADEMLYESKKAGRNRYTFKAL